MHQEHVGYSVTRGARGCARLILAWQHGNRASSLFLVEQPAAWLARVKVTALLAACRQSSSRGYRAWTTYSRSISREPFSAPTSGTYHSSVSELAWTVLLTGHGSRVTAILPSFFPVHRTPGGEHRGMDKNTRRRNYWPVL